MSRSGLTASLCPRSDPVPRLPHPHLGRGDRRDICALLPAHITMVRPARPGPSRTGSALAVSTWPCPTRSTPRCSSWTSTSQPLRQRAQRGAPAADRRPADPLGRARAQAHLGQSHPDQRHVPSAVADRLRLRRRQQCEHPPAGRDTALSRTRRPDGYEPRQRGKYPRKLVAGKTPSSRQRDPRPTSGRAGSTTPTSCCRENTSPGWSRPRSAGGPHGLPVVVPASQGQCPPSAPIRSLTEHTSRRRRQKPGTAHHD